jgi:DNA-binding response OmpR family regulator
MERDDRLKPIANGGQALAAGVLAGRRVLLVEDTFIVADELGNALRRLECAVVGPFASVEDARLAAMSEPLDLALLDINLDGEPVYPIAHKLLERQIPFVFLTGYTGEAIDGSFRSFPRLTKPFGPSELRDAMRAALADR